MNRIPVEKVALEVDVKHEYGAAGALIRFLTSRIDDGSFAPGMPLESTSEYARKFNISLVTAQNALSKLAAGGYIVRRHGARTVVADRTVRTPRSIGIPLFSISTTTTLRDELPHDFMAGMLHETFARGYDMRVLHPRGENFDCRMLRDSGLAGVLVVHSKLRTGGPLLEFVLELRKLGMPLVFAGLLDPDYTGQFNHLEWDYFAGGRMALEYLQRCGCRRPAVLSLLPLDAQNFMTYIQRGMCAGGAEIRTASFDIARPDCFPEYRDAIVAALRGADGVVCQYHKIAEYLETWLPGIRTIVMDPVRSERRATLWPDLEFEGKLAMQMLSEVIADPQASPRHLELALQVIEPEACDR